MRFSTFGKLAALAVLAIVTSITTSKVIAIARASQLQPPRGNTQETATNVIDQPDDAEDFPGNVGETIENVVDRPGDPPVAKGVTLGRNVVSGGAMNQFDTFVHGRTVSVDARATIQDSRPNMQFVWAVRVFAPEDKKSALFEKIYEDQVFTLGAEQTVETTFVDQLELPLPAGKYTFELTWFSLPPDQGLAGLNDPVTRRLHKGAAGIANIEIGF